MESWGQGLSVTLPLQGLLDGDGAGLFLGRASLSRKTSGSVKKLKVVPGPVAERCLVKGLGGSPGMGAEGACAPWEKDLGPQGGCDLPVARSSPGPLPKAGKGESKVPQFQTCQPWQDAQTQSASVSPCVTPAQHGAQHCRVTRLWGPAPALTQTRPLQATGTFYSLSSSSFLIRWLYLWFQSFPWKSPSLCTCLSCTL